MKLKVVDLVREARMRVELIFKKRIDRLLDKI
jgi:hypothetical protein